MNTAYNSGFDFKNRIEDLRVPLICSLALNLILVIVVPYFTYIKPKISKNIYKIDLFRMPPPVRKKKEVIKKKEKPPPKLPDDTENINKDAKQTPPPEEQVYQMEDLDDMPRILVMVKPKYPESLRLSGKEDTVKLKFMINYYGYVEKVSVVIPSSHELFDKASVDAVKKWQFTPPKINGKPASVWFVVPIRFDLE